MRRESLVGLVPVLLVGWIAGCGEPYSNEDLVFLAALPEREQLEARVPASEGTSSAGAARAELAAGTSAAGVGDVSELFKDTRAAADDLNRVVGFPLILLDAVRRFPVTTREENRRIWGPFPSDKQPEFEFRVFIEREAPEAHKFRWAVEYRPRAERGRPWQPLLVGGSSATESFQRSRGEMSLLVAQAVAAGLDLEDDPKQGSAGIEALTSLNIGYDTEADPVTVTLDAEATSGERVSFQSRRAADDSSGLLVFRVRKEFIGRQVGEPAEVPDTLQITTRWRASGAGRADVSIVEGNGTGFTALECWGSDSRVVYQETNWNGASVGVKALCIPPG